MRRITAEFCFDIGDQVQTPLGDRGVITVLAIDSSRHAIYCVRTTWGPRWYKAEQLKLLESCPR